MWEVCVGSNLLLEQGSGGVHKEGGGQAEASKMSRDFHVGKTVMDIRKREGSLSQWVTDLEFESSLSGAQF